MNCKHAAFQLFATLMVVLLQPVSGAEPDEFESIRSIINSTCVECHNDETSEGGLDLSSLTFQLHDHAIRDRWIQIHDRVASSEMPPDADELPASDRSSFVRLTSNALHRSDMSEVEQSGRGPLRRLNRDEYQQNLRDILKLPALDIRDILPEDREGHHFNKTTEVLDISRVQLTAYLDAAEKALHSAIATGIQPRPVTRYRAVGARLFPGKATFGNRQAMFFARNGEGIDNKEVDESPDDPEIEMALFRSAHWPYYGYPQGFVAQLPGEYKVRFSGRAVRQMPDFKLKPAIHPLPMTFRARKPSGPDVSGDVRATGGIMDIQSEQAIYETTVRLRARETFEYSLLGLPVPLARNVNNGPPTYRYPPFPKDGQPGVAFQWLEVEGPLSPDTWPSPSHQVLFDDLPVSAAPAESDLPVDVESKNPQGDARRLLRRFIRNASRQPVSDEDIQSYDELILSRLDQNVSFAEAMLTGYKAFLCSRHILYLNEPGRIDDQFAIASRLSHFLTNSRPDKELLKLAQSQQLRTADVLHAEINRLIHGKDFERFVTSFTDYWLDLRHVHRDPPDFRRFPEYRFDAWLVESMEQEVRTFFTAMVRENLPVSVLVKADFVFANDRLSKHYGLPLLSGSSLRKVPLPEGSPFGGLLTQAAILKVTANGTSTSPVVRGAWVMDRIIGLPPPPPPASVPAVEPDIRGATTIRELMELHTRSDSCAGCHARFDPVGLALEKFDILGAWRTHYRGLDAGRSVSGIDRAGHDFTYTLTGTVDASGKLLDGRSFQDINELKKLLASDPRQLARNMLHQFTVYATGTPVRFSDRREVESMLDLCSDDGYRVGDLLHALVHSRIFLGRLGSE